MYLFFMISFSFLLQSMACIEFYDNIFYPVKKHESELIAKLPRSCVMKNGMTINGHYTNRKVSEQPAHTYMHTYQRLNYYHHFY